MNCLNMESFPQSKPLLISASMAHDNLSSQSPIFQGDVRDGQHLCVFRDKIFAASPPPIVFELFLKQRFELSRVTLPIQASAAPLRFQPQVILEGDLQIFEGEEDHFSLFRKAMA